MKIATIIFTYNRSYHTERVIDGLKKNSILPYKLYIFQDGLKKEKDRKEWQKVNRLIHEIDWCEKEIMVAEYNKGLAASIISGLNYVFKEHEAVIVLEDDCVPARCFLAFMYQCLEKYRDMSRVYSVSGYAWPIELSGGEDDVYFCGRISSWGWGTWKDRWRSYRKDYSLLKRIEAEAELAEDLRVWGADLERTLWDNIKGKNDSWAVFWALEAIRNKYVCINPYHSLIQNIGHDGTGVNCGKSQEFEVETDKRKAADFKLPDKISVLETTKKAFAMFSEKLRGKSSEEIQTYYRNCLEQWVKFKQQGNSISSVLLAKRINKIAVFGTGTMGKLLAEELAGGVEITYFVVTNRRENHFMGYSVYDCSTDFPGETEEILLIVIPGYDIDIIRQNVGKHFKNIYTLEGIFRLGEKKPHISCSEKNTCGQLKGM